MTCIPFLGLLWTAALILSLLPSHISVSYHIEVLIIHLTLAHYGQSCHTQDNKLNLAQVMPNIPTVMLHHDLQFNQYTNMATPSFTKISHITTLFGLHDDKSKKDSDVYTSYSLTSHPLHQQMIICWGVTGFGHQVHQVNLSRLSSRNVFFWSQLPKA